MFELGLIFEQRIEDPRTMSSASLRIQLCLFEQFCPGVKASFKVLEIVRQNIKISLVFRIR
jgi:hypothetical protein